MQRLLLSLYFLSFSTIAQAKKKKKTPDDGSEIEVTPEKKKYKEDVEALIKDEDTSSEGFKAKAETIFEAALQSKIISETAKLEERYESDLAGEVEAIKEDFQWFFV